MILLYYIALILFALFGVVNFFYLMISKRKYPRGYWLQTAKNIDKFGNTEFKALWNGLLIKQSPFKFGLPYQTISEVLGINYLTKSLTLLGKFAVFLLTPNHCLKAINAPTIKEEPLTIVLRVATWIGIITLVCYVAKIIL
jgi:hypothetical protein